MIIDGVFIKHLVNELNTNLEKSRLEKIFLSTEKVFVMQFYHKGRKQKCVIDLDPSSFSSYISNKDLSSTTTSQFLLTLKKQLEGGILESITQHQTDRVMIFDFTVFDFIDGPILKRLIFEAMGKHANLLLVKDSVLIDSYKKMFFESGRQLIPGANFEFFPSNKKTFDVIDYSTLDSPKMMTSMYMGISLKLAKHIFSDQLQISDLKVIPTKDLETQNGYFMDIFLKNHKKKVYPTLSELLDDHTIEDKQFKQKYEIFIEKYLKKLVRKKEQLTLSLIHSKELLLSKDKADYIYQSGLDLHSKAKDIEVYGMHIILDEHLTLNENAQYFYKLYHKAKRGLTHIEQQLKQNNLLIDLFNNYKTYIDISAKIDINDLEQELIAYGYKSNIQMKNTNKKQKSIPNFLSITDDQATYLVGKNNIQNEYVTHVMAKPEDYFFHVKDAPGSHVIVKTKNLNEHVLRKACMLAAHYSSLKLSSSIPVDYTLVKNLKKIPRVPGYKVIIKNQKTMYIDIDQEKVNSYLK
ncbi:MAG: NFACT family protein [Acholeplasmataceae bacterium]|nr:NFACT family protein [Acholeplasmataceae bacterium]